MFLLPKNDFQCQITAQKVKSYLNFFFFLRFAFFFFNLFIYGCVGSSFLCEGSLQLRQVGATLHRGARASHHRGPPCCGAQAPDAQAQQLWLTGLVAPRHVGSSRTRAWSRVPCIGRQILNHCATREAPVIWTFKQHKIILKHSTDQLKQGVVIQLVFGRHP